MLAFAHAALLVESTCVSFVGINRNGFTQSMTRLATSLVDRSRSSHSGASATAALVHVCSGFTMSAHASRKRASIRVMKPLRSANGIRAAEPQQRVPSFRRCQRSSSAQPPRNASPRSLCGLPAARSSGVKQHLRRGRRFLVIPQQSLGSGTPTVTLPCVSVPMMANPPCSL